MTQEEVCEEFITFLHSNKQYLNIFTRIITCDLSNYSVNLEKSLNAKMLDDANGDIDEYIRIVNNKQGGKIINVEFPLLCLTSRLPPVSICKIWLEFLRNFSTNHQREIRKQVKISNSLLIRFLRENYSSRFFKDKKIIVDNLNYNVEGTPHILLDKIIPNHSMHAISHIIHNDITWHRIKENFKNYYISMME